MSFPKHRNTQVQLAADVWKALRSPFALPPCSFACHTCKFEKIDIDILGCLLCGNIHACSDGDCQQISESDDGTVCLLTGVVIRHKKFVDDEYNDTQILCDMPFSTRIFDEESGHEQIHQALSHVLLSDITKKLHARQAVITMEKWFSKLKNSAWIAHTACTLMAEAVKSKKIIEYNSKVRKQLVNQCSDIIYTCIKTLVHNFGMPLKLGELSNVAVGMVYLMRSGIYFEGLVILPKFMILNEFLPTENCLPLHFDIKSKFVTESEV